MVEGLKFQFAHEELIAHFDKEATKLRLRVTELEQYSRNCGASLLAEKYLFEARAVRDKMRKIEILKQHLIPAKYILTAEEVAELGLLE